MDDLIEYYKQSESKMLALLEQAKGPEVKFLQEMLSETRYAIRLMEEAERRVTSNLFP